MASVRTQGAGLAPGAWRAGLMLQTLLTSQAPRDGLPAMPETSFERDALWRHGISGDAPIVLLRVADATGVVMVRELCALLQAQGSPLPVDVVVLDAETPSYLAPVSSALRSLAEQQVHGRCRLHLLADDAVGPDTRFALNLLARVRWFADGRPLALQLERLAIAPEQAAKARRSAGATRVSSVAALPGTLTPVHRFDNRQRRVPLRAGRGRAAAAAVDQRHCQRALRLPGVRARRRHELGRQQPPAPDHALVQRCAAGFARRVADAALPGQRPRLAAGPRQPAAVHRPHARRHGPRVHAARHGRAAALDGGRGARRQAMPGGAARRTRPPAAPDAAAGGRAMGSWVRTAARAAASSRGWSRPRAKARCWRWPRRPTA